MRRISVEKCRENSTKNSRLYRYSNEAEVSRKKVILKENRISFFRCRLICRQWKELVDKSSQWRIVKLSANCPNIERALEYFQNVDIRELVCWLFFCQWISLKIYVILQDLSEIICENFESNASFYLYSLRSLSISTNHSLAFFTFLFQIAPFLHFIKFIVISSSSTNNHLYNCVQCLVNQCQDRLKCLRCLHIQLRSQSDQVEQIFSKKKH